MYGRRHAGHLVVSVLLAALLGQARSDEPITEDDTIFHFISRPDIRASRWNITIFHEDQIAPGYWFVAPYEVLNQPPDVGDPGWIGPHIYDGRGELVWSGASMFDNRNVEDFRMSNVNGEDLMTLIYQDIGAGVIIDDGYEIRAEAKIDDAWTINTHELHFVDNGTRALVVKNDKREASLDQSQEVGFDGQCVAEYEHFLELDTETWEAVFDWDSKDHVRLNESTLTDSPVEDRCSDWDFFHSNSVDKTPNGDYLLSSRHTDTIYKVSGEGGHIIWRLGGKMSDFGQGDWTFSRQHHIRFRDQNATHTILSVLDNARGIDSQEPTYGTSRGLLLAVDEENMAVTILTQIDHPDGEGNYAPRRGNYQMLPDGNVFIGWSESSIQSEHAPDGTILAHARMMADWLGSYRSYKFKFTGSPAEKPAVHSAAFTTETGSSATIVHVSWNGATEVASWNMYKTTENDDIRVLVGWTERTGFENSIKYNGFASFVLLEAVGKDGETLGVSEVTETITSANITSDALSAEDEWLGAFSKGQPSFKKTMVAFSLGAVSGIIATLIVTLWYRGAFTRMKVPKWFPVPARYQQLAEEDQEQGGSLRQTRRSQYGQDPHEDSVPLRSKKKNSLDSLSESDS